MFPYSKSNPVWIDNDAALDTYTHDYLFALAHLGEINVVGLSVSAPIAPFRSSVTAAIWNSEFWNGTVANVAAARNSGLKNIPDPVVGIMGHLAQPTNSVIESTVKKNTAGTKAFVAAARACTPQLPLLVIVGGPLSIAADACLVDPTIADKVIIGWLNRLTPNFNSWQDPWALFIVLQRMRMVLFDFHPYSTHLPAVPRTRILSDLPPSPLRQFMYDKDIANGGALGYDGDGPPAVAIMRSDFVTQLQSIQWSGSFVNYDGHNHPTMTTGGTGRIQFAASVNAQIGTNEFWRALKGALSISPPAPPPPAPPPPPPPEPPPPPPITPVVTEEDVRETLALTKELVAWSKWQPGYGYDHPQVALHWTELEDKLNSFRPAHVWDLV